MVGLDVFDIPGVSEIAKRAEAQRLARHALIAGNAAEARRLAEEANRYAHLARVRLAARRERSAP